MRVLKKSNSSTRTDRSRSRRAYAVRIHPLAACLTSALVLLAAGTAEATGGIAGTWRTIYPGSASESNASCQLCHATAGGSNFNTYGWAIKQGIDSGSSRTAAIQTVEGVDSDSDPTGSDNATEISADTQPGWTSGANTVFDGGGNPSRLRRSGSSIPPRRSPTSI